jgi:hypothetical protein
MPGSRTGTDAAVDAKASRVVLLAARGWAVMADPTSAAATAMSTSLDVGVRVVDLTAVPFPQGILPATEV